VLVVLQIVTGIGLWRMAKWGWWIVVILQTLGVAGAVLNVIAVLFVPGAAHAGSPLVFVITGLVSGGILYWFFTNRHLFNGTPAYRTVIGPDGTAVSEPVVSSGNSNITAVIIIGVVLVFFILPVVAIAVLTLLGPQIGNVFSGITNNLAAP
jgi:hypothetical protein